MKKMVLAALLAVSANLTFAQVNVGRNDLGSGSPELKGTENAVHWDNDIYHAPQYMPGYPTAATLWVRVIDVPCTKVVGILNCDGYHWTPDMGRGEYLMIRPVIREVPLPVTNTITIREVPVIILKEVPAKKKGE